MGFVVRGVDRVALEAAGGEPAVGVDDDADEVLLKPLARAGAHRRRQGRKALATRIKLRKNKTKIA